MPGLNNTGSATAIVVGVAVVAVPALVAGPLLGALGFGAAGITAGQFLEVVLCLDTFIDFSGSAAAGIQSGIGSVVAPGLFATLQSAGAGGYGLAAVHTVVQAAGALVAAAGVARNQAQGGDEDGNEDEDNDSKED
ncbi:hypothetical protein HG530_003538 [Fusarium avenaceum]|nr:hypothetical protein HG530_003538 [Fusarium avenaceum]